MKHLRRLAILTAATTLVGASAMAGVGVASAQMVIDWKIDSPSAVFVERLGDGNLIVSYDNQSGRQLYCYSYIGPRVMVEALYDGHVESGLVYPGPQIPEGDWPEIEDAINAGQWAPGFFAVDPGESGPVTFLHTGDEGGELIPTPLEQPSDKAFSAAVLTACAHPQTGGEDAEPEDPYIELEKFITADDEEDEDLEEDPMGGLFGSLANLFPALGS